jgi:hypothetical protein
MMAVTRVSTHCELSGARVWPRKIAFGQEIYDVQCDAADMNYDGSEARSSVDVAPKRSSFSRFLNSSRYH